MSLMFIPWSHQLFTLPDGANEPTFLFFGTKPFTQRNPNWVFQQGNFFSVHFFGSSFENFSSKNHIPPPVCY